MIQYGLEVYSVILSFFEILLDTQVQAVFLNPEPLAEPFLLGTRSGNSSCVAQGGLDLALFPPGRGASIRLGS